MIRPRLALLAVVTLACGRAKTGERLARTNCAVCHAFPEPALLDKRTWRDGVLPEMGPRLGVSSHSLYAEVRRNPNIPLLRRAVSEDDWRKIVAYYLAAAPDSLPPQKFPDGGEPVADPSFFRVAPFVPRLQSSGVITLLQVDSANRRLYVGEAGSNLLRVFDWKGRLLASVQVGSPPTGAIVAGSRVLVLLSGILDPNDEPRGSLVEYDWAGTTLRAGRVLIDSLYRPVFIGRSHADFIICEYGNNLGRLALYRPRGDAYERRVLAESPGAIRFELRDLTGDGVPDLVALFAQGDERIVEFPGDTAGNFAAPRVLARFPPVYGSMHFELHDFNGDGKLDIVYVNGDNFDFSRVLKPYHGVRILENDGAGDFVERYFYPVYGAAQTVVADFDGDGDLDMLVASNFAAPGQAERGIVYLENRGGYRFQPYSFTQAQGNQWNVMAAADLNGDGRPDAIVGAMSLASIAQGQRYGGRGIQKDKVALLLFESR